MADRVDRPYSVRSAARSFEIVNASGRTVMSCRDAASAAHYADLLNAAWDAGYRQGRRDQKGS